MDTAPASLAVVAALAAALWLNGLQLSVAQVRARWRARAFARPEDARMLGLAPATEPDVARRAGEAWRNELENSPMFLVTCLVGVLADASAAALAAACAVFVAARVVQGHAQITARQPLRTIAWLAGVGAHAALLGVILFALRAGAA